MSKEKQKDHSNVINLWIAVIIIFIMAFSVGFIVKAGVSPKKVTENSNGFVFTKQGKFWVTTIRNPSLLTEYNVEFRYSPSQVKNVSTVGNPVDFFRLMKLNNLTAAYFTFDSSGNLTFINIVAADTSRLLNSLNGVTLVAACTKNETSACADRPIVTCDNQLDKSLVIYVKQSNEPKVSLSKNCLTIEGSGEELLRASDKLYFLWYNII